MSGARVWYTSDLHLGHRGCAEWRGFESVDEHDATIVNNWNDLVHKDDTVWVLGDVCLSARALDTVRLLKGTKHLITGNHDAVFPGNRTSHKQQLRWWGYFESIQPFARRRVEGVEFLLSHFPYAGDHTTEARPDAKDRYTQYRLRNEGLPLVHGHLHSPEVYNRERPRQIHVGLDAWNMQPVAQEVVVSLLKEIAAEEAKHLPVLIRRTPIFDIEWRDDLA